MFLETENGMKVYGSGKAEVRALDGVNFSLKKGRICVIPGPVA